MALFGAETTATVILMCAPLAGLLLGVAQWWLLRRQLPGARVWPVVTTVAYTLAWFITAQAIGENRSLGFVIFGASGAVTYQALTGLLLWRLLRSGVTAARS